MRKFQKSNNFFTKVKEVIPLASQTFSKSYFQYIKGPNPLFLTHGKGARVWDLDGNEYVDFINGLLAVLLGYQYKAVDDAIRGQLKKGISFSLASPLEYELAQLLKKIIPCAEMVRFGKNGSDATSGAVRLARAVTKREHVAVCGYHGWHDWYIGSTPRNMGVPESTKALTHSFSYNDISSLEKIFQEHKGQIAAVVMEPMNYVEPENNFLQNIRALCTKEGTLLVFDEIITGFRFHIGGAQKLFKVIPDLATFGKSMANGMPISVLAGKKEYMKELENLFFSFTFGGEALSLAASIATIKEIQEKQVIPYIWKLGAYLQKGTKALLEKHGLSEIIAVKGKPCWQVFIIKSTDGASDLEIKSYIQQEVLQEGFLWYGQHNMSFSHKKSDIDRLLKAYDRIFGEVGEYLREGTLKSHLKGEPITNIFKLR